jgi:hypothetical protein
MVFIHFVLVLLNHRHAVERELVASPRAHHVSLVLVDISKMVTIFGDYLDIFMNMHSNESVREAVRREQLSEYVQQHNLSVHYYQDYGWEAKELEF